MGIVDGAVTEDVKIVAVTFEKGVARVFLNALEPRAVAAAVAVVFIAVRDA